MKYKEYIELGFTREDINDRVEMDFSGYTGYFLNYKVIKNVTIEVYYNELNNPKLYIEKEDGKYEIIDLSIQQLHKLVNN
jgi:hypothetical protein